MWPVWEPMFMIDRRNLRATYSAEVAAALGDYMQQSGLFSFISDGGTPSPLEIRFTLQDAELYQSLLERRLAQTSEPDSR